MSASFPLNAWYACAYDVELKRELLARTVCNQKLVMFRQLDGSVAILEDACWHRLLPLSKGRLDGDEVTCGYHGLVYNAEGRCTRMPSQETINPSACVRSYPVVEKHRFVWVWPGETALADPALVPDMHWNDDPTWAGDGKMIRVACDYRLVLDNLMDLTHETFVHGSSIGQAAVAEAPFVATHGDRTATVTRWMENIDAPPFWARQIKRGLGYEGPVDRWQIIKFEAPATINIDVGVAETGTGAPPTGDELGDRRRGVNGYVLNTIYTMRSQDIFQKNVSDLIVFSLLAEDIAKRLSINLSVPVRTGFIDGLIADAHIYQNTYDAAFDTVSTYRNAKALETI